jgi:integrase
MKKQTTIIPRPESTTLAVMNNVMHQAGQVANQAAGRRAFDRHIEGKARNTERRKRADLELFETFLRSVTIPAEGMFDDPRAWQGVTWGIVESFKAWQLQQGYAIASINGRLSTVRTYAELAAKAGVLSADELRMIQTVKGFANKEKPHIDARRRDEGLDTRVGAKKARSIIVPDDVVDQLTTPRDDTLQARRDSLLMCLLFHHGLRISEAAILTRAAFDLKAGTITFYRPKVDLTQTHVMTPETRKAAMEYLKHAPESGIIWRKTCKGTGNLSSQMSESSAIRALAKRVEYLGHVHGIEGLSPHDARHTDATHESNSNTPLRHIMSKFGWKSPAMAMRYIEAAHIANEGTARVA